jgi:Rod binding domain-containing protein
MATPIASSSHFDTAMMMASQSQQASARGAVRNLRTREQAQDFEAMFLNSMFEHMMTGIDGEGPFGGSQGVGVWRSFITGEYAKSIAKKGGIGIADQVYNSLIQHQAAASASGAPRAAQKEAL